MQPPLSTHYHLLCFGRITSTRSAHVSASSQRACRPRPAPSRKTSAGTQNNGTSPCPGSRRNSCKSSQPTFYHVAAATASFPSDISSRLISASSAVFPFTYPFPQQLQVQPRLVNLCSTRVDYKLPRNFSLRSCFRSTRHPPGYRCTQEIRASPQCARLPPAPIDPSHTYNRCSTRLPFLTQPLNRRTRGSKRPSLGSAPSASAQQGQTGYIFPQESRISLYRPSVNSFP